MMHKLGTLMGPDLNGEKTGENINASLYDGVWMFLENRMEYRVIAFPSLVVTRIYP